MTPEDRLAQLGVTLPPVRPNVGIYLRHRIAAGMLYISGQGPHVLDGIVHNGKVGRDVTTEEAYEHARVVGLNVLAVVRDALGSLDDVGSIVKITGMVNCTPDYHDIPQVINGCSDLFVDVFGETGRHARSVVGMNSLPFGISVEIDAIIEIGQQRNAA